MIKIQLKDNIYIGYVNGFITTYKKGVIGVDSKNAGEECYSTALTYLNEANAANGILESYGVLVTRDEVSKAYEQSKLESLIETARMPKKGFGKKAGE